MNNPLHIMFHGLPGTGKTTATHIVQEIHNVKYIVSTDSIIEAECNRLGMTYNQGWASLIKPATTRMNNSRSEIIANNYSFIDDHTNLTLGGRKRKLASIPKNYINICYVFDIPPVEWRKRLNSRPNKTIPNDVLEQMINNTVFPTLGEGFDAILKFVY